MAKKYPHHSSLICFGRAILGQRLTKPAISKNFKKTVDKADYDPDDKKDILEHLHLITNIAEGDIFED